VKKVLALLLLLLLAPAGSGLEPLDFADEELRLRYQRLAAELRCPKCSNQSLRDSDAPVAANLRPAGLAAGTSAGREAGMASMSP